MIHPFLVPRNIGVVPDKPDPRDRPYTKRLAADFGPYIGPEEWDNRHAITIHDQGATFACASFATCNSLESIVQRDIGVVGDLSPKMVYYGARRLWKPDIEPPIMEPTDLRTAMRATSLFGSCPHDHWDDLKAHDAQVPPDRYHNAYRAITYGSLGGVGIDGVKTLIWRGYGIAVSWYYTRNWTQLDMWGDPNSGTPAARDTVEPYDPSQVVGLHANTLVGFKPGYWLAANSWGRWWADKGCAWVPQDYYIVAAWTVATVGRVWQP